MAGQPALGFAGLLRQLRAQAGLSPRTASALERGIHRFAHQDSARLLADALDLPDPVRGLFVAAARAAWSQPPMLAARRRESHGGPCPAMRYS